MVKTKDLLQKREIRNNKRTVVYAKTIEENDEDDVEQEEEPVVKKSCTIDLSMFA